MNHDLIYAKTASGEGEMHQRTRAMQRNVRMVLILVDSQSTVGDLCLKTGNPQLTEEALRELEKGGFIEPRVEVDSLWEEGNKVAQEIRAAAGQKRTTVERSAIRAEPSAPGGTSSTPSTMGMTFPSDWSISRFSLASRAPGPAMVGQTDPDPLNERVRQFAGKAFFGKSLASVAASAKALFFGVGGSRNKSEPIAVDRCVTPPPVESRRQPSPVAIERLMELAPAEREKPIPFRPVRRRQGRSSGWLAITAGCLAGVLSLLFLVILLFPYDRYVPELELAFTSAMGRPVRVGSMRLEIYPKPVLLLGEVRIALEKNASPGELQIKELRLQPLLSTLMSRQKVFHEVVVSGVSLPAERMVGLSAIFAELSRPSGDPVIRHLRLERAEVSFGGLGFSGLEGEVRLSADGHLQSVLLNSVDRSLSLAATARDLALDVALEGIAWRPVSGSRFLFDSVNVQGFVENEAFTIRRMELRIFDGLIEGGAVLNGDRTPRLVGDVRFQRVNAARLGGALGFGDQFSGQAAGNMHFSTSAESWATIFSAIDAEGEFAVQRGSIRGIDLTEAARSISRAPVQGGVTQFESLSGEVRLKPAGYRFSGLVLNSGLMQSTGSLEIGKALDVNGRMALKMRGSVNQTQVPLTIGGPLRAPTVQIGRGE